MALKPKYCHFVHSGALVEPSKTGRKPKRRIQGKLEKVIEVASDVKAAPVNALDVKKAAVNLEQMDVNYIQSWSVLRKKKMDWESMGQESYQFVAPYLKAFSNLNPMTVAVHECDDDNHLTRLFVCPGMYLHAIGDSNNVL